MFHRMEIGAKTANAAEIDEEMLKELSTPFASGVTHPHSNFWKDIAESTYGLLFFSWKLKQVKSNITKIKAH